MSGPQGNGAVSEHAGDLRDAPFPEGASEFVDVDCAVAAGLDIRYAVAVVNNYEGMAFEELERAFAGLMLRDDVHGAHFAPQTVELKFNLQGGNGIFLPMVVDLVENKLHWLDVYSRGEFAFNNVASSNNAITTICPTMIDYFASGIRTTMYDLVLLHAAARGKRVTIRSATPVVLERENGEPNGTFLLRLRAQRQLAPVSSRISQDPVFAALVTADMELPEGSTVYALKPGVMSGNVSASDLIA